MFVSFTRTYISILYSRLHIGMSLALAACVKLFIERWKEKEKTSETSRAFHSARLQLTGNKKQKKHRPNRKIRPRVLLLVGCGGG